MPIKDDLNDKIEVFERLAKIEALQIAIHEALQDQKQHNRDITEKIDEILDNMGEDSEKVEKLNGRVYVLNEKVKNIKTILWLFLPALVGGLVAKFFV